MDSDPTLPQPPRPHDPPTQADLSGDGGACPVVRRIGDYELLYEIGRGGMGVVFKARDLKLNRFVAVKMILPGAMPDENDLQRFHTEAVGRRLPAPPQHRRRPSGRPARTAAGTTAWT